MLVRAAHKCCSVGARGKLVPPKAFLSFASQVGQRPVKTSLPGARTLGKERMSHANRSSPFCPDCVEKLLQALGMLPDMVLDVSKIGDLVAKIAQNRLFRIFSSQSAYCGHPFDATRRQRCTKNAPFGGAFEAAKFES